MKKRVKLKKISFDKLKLFLFISLVVFFFFFFTITSVLAIYERRLEGKIYQGIKVNNVSVSLKTKGEVSRLFEAKNASFSQASFGFTYEGKIATISASQINLGYNAKLIADQAMSIGRTKNFFADTFNKGRAWFSEINLPASYSLDRRELEKSLLPFTKDINKLPSDAMFEIKNGRVVAFRPSEDGKEVDISNAEQMILENIPKIIANNVFYIELPLPIKTVKPKISLEDTNNLGIKENIGKGQSRFVGSIANRIHNIALAASRIDGTIVKPGQIFSFNDTVGDVSKLTGYKEAYIIKDGKTILGDGGGVCQVSTTLFRAVLNSGLPIIERHPHSYRVSYYEQDSPPGLDATVYAPSYDLKFKNDTGASILIEAYTDPVNATLTFEIYGTSDNRQVSLTKPVVTNQIPAPEDRYQDDPTLPIGTIKQVDFKAAGATVSFSRTVKRNEEVVLSDNFVSKYQPWQAVFLRGTKENL